MNENIGMTDVLSQINGYTAENSPHNILQNYFYSINTSNPSGKWQ